MFWRMKRYFREREETKAARKVCKVYGHQWETVRDNPQMIVPGNSNKNFPVRVWSAKKAINVTSCKRCGEIAGQRGHFPGLRW
ncbi:MAG: hypothetical protein LBV67_11980 [Streptococcaceae bacterium]|jgi:hypothetical protein|nr:hypothetical protein [Streptococcaceae bacterium]